MQNKAYTIFLADDDEDDRQFFIDAFNELPESGTITTFENGVELMDGLLRQENYRPDMIFIELFMPMMDGEECLADIRDEPTLADIPVTIYSTALETEKTKTLREKGANLYLRKLPTFSELKNALSQCVRFIDDTSAGNGGVDFIIQY